MSTYVLYNELSGNGTGKEKAQAVNKLLTGKALVYDEKIRAIVDPTEIGDAEVIDAKGLYVMPGLIDMHIHGYMGFDSDDGNKEDILTMARELAKNGVTSWLPTTMTVGYDTLEAAFESIRQAMKVENDGANILGVNSEGPFICDSKKGAQNPAYIKPCDVDFLKKHSDIIRVFTVAPEEPGNMEAIRTIAAETSMLISIGHSNADYKTACESIEAGVRHATHLFNAMTPLNHRDPGVVGAALADDRVMTEMIADTFHISADLFGLVAKVKGDNLILITDCTRAGGLADGEYTLGGQPIFVKGIECRLKDGTIAGSVLRLNNAVRNVRDHTNLPLEQIVRMASLNPARAIGVADRKGSLEAGKDADIVLTDADFQVQRTIIGGETVYEKA